MEVTELDARPVHQLDGRRPPTGAVSVCADTGWANPFSTGGDRDARAVALAQYAVWLAGRADLLAAARAELARPGVWVPT